MELFKLRYFVTAYEEKSFTRAAERHFVARQSLRHAIRSIEEDLGAPLFLVQGKTITPTHVAKRLYPAAINLLKANSRFEKQLEEITRPDAPQLIAFAQTCGIQDVFSAQEMQSLRNENNQAVKACRFVTKSDAECLEMLLMREVDIASIFSAVPQGDPRVRFRCHKSGRLYLLVNQANPLAAKRRACIDDLRDVRFVTMGPSHTLHQIIHNACVQRGFSPASTYLESHFFELTKQVENNLGVSYYPTYCQAPYGMDNVVCLPFEEPLNWYFGAAIRTDTLPNDPIYQMWDTDLG